MATVERRGTDEIVAAIHHGETQRKIWFLITVAAFVFSTAVLVRQGNHSDWGQLGTDFVYSPITNGVLAIASMLFYKARVRAGEKIGFILPAMLALLSCVLVWMLTR